MIDWDSGDWRYWFWCDTCHRYTIFNASCLMYAMQDAIKAGWECREDLVPFPEFPYVRRITPCKCPECLGKERLTDTET